MRLSPRIALLMFALALVAVFVTPLRLPGAPCRLGRAPQPADLGDARRRRAAILPMALAVVLALGTAPPPRAQRCCARGAGLSSILLFSAGGLIGVFIAGSNVRIPRTTTAASSA